MALFTAQLLQTAVLRGGMTSKWGRILSPLIRASLMSGPPLRWRPVAGWIEVDRVPPTLFSDRGGPLGVIPPAVAANAGRGPRRGPPAVLRRACAARRQGCIQGLSGAAARDRLDGLRQGAVRRAQASAALSVALHPPYRDLQSPAGR